jgi:hypothetical protein
MKFIRESSSNTDVSMKIDYNNFNEDSAYIERAFSKIAQQKLLITKKRNYKFYLRLILVSILISLYYCLILSMEKEIELVTAKIFHSIIVFLLTLIENFLMDQMINSKNKFVVGKSYADQKYSKDNYELMEQEEDNQQRCDRFYEEIDSKEMYFYNVICAMLSFTSEILLYYFLSLSSSFNVNIGTMYTLTVIEFIILIVRLPYFNVNLGIIQFSGIFFTLLSAGCLYFYYVPDYNTIVIIFTSITVSMFKFIKYSIFEYVHNKTKYASKLVRESTYVEGMIGLLLIFFILFSRKGGLMISDMGNLMKVVLASFFYYFAMKISLYNEKHYYLFVIYSSLNFIFITLFDYLINNRTFTAGQFMLITSCSLFSIFSFVQGSALKKFFENTNKKFLIEGETK